MLDIFVGLKTTLKIHINLGKLKMRKIVSTRNHLLSWYDWQYKNKLEILLISSLH